MKSNPLENKNDNARLIFAIREYYRKRGEDKWVKLEIVPFFYEGQTLYAITNTGTHPIVCLCESP